MFDRGQSRAEERLPDTSWYVSWLSKKKGGGKPLYGVWCSGKKKRMKGRPFVCWTTLRHGAATSSDFIHQEECDIMGLHSASSDSVLPLATCPACIPLCKQSEYQGSGGPRGEYPFLPPTLFIQDPAQPCSLVCGLGFFFFPLCRQLWQPPPQLLHQSPAISHWVQLWKSLRLNGGKQTHKGPWQPSVNGTCVSQRPRCLCGSAPRDESI